MSCINSFTTNKGFFRKLVKGLLQGRCIDDIARNGKYRQ